MSRKKAEICAPCAEMLREKRAYTAYPPHLVHTEHGNPDVWRIYGEAICPTCLTRWRHRRDNRAEIVG